MIAEVELSSDHNYNRGMRRGR